VFFYGALAIVLLTITAVEIQLGIYAGSAIGDAILKTIGTALFIGGVVSPVI
jgi:predicted phage tail protein